MDAEQSFGSSSQLPSVGHSPSLSSKSQAESQHQQQGEEDIFIPAKIHTDTDSEEEEEKEPTATVAEEPATDSLFPGFRTTGAPPRVDGFTPMPYFAGDVPGTTWSEPPVINGERQSPLSIESGLLARDLSKPGAARYMDPGNGPQTPDEWLDLWKQSFDDLAIEITDKELAQSAFEKRVALETAYFRGDQTKIHSVERLLTLKDPDAAVRFQFRYGNKYYGLATRVDSRDKVDAIYERIGEQNARFEFLSISGQVEKKLAACSTTKELDNMLDMLKRLKTSYERPGAVDKTAVEAVTKWMETCITKRLAAARIEEEQKKQKGEGEADGEDDDDGEVDEDKKKVETVEQPCHVVGTVSYPLDKETLLIPIGARWPDVTQNPAYAPDINDDSANGLKCRFDWITSEQIVGTLYTVGALPTCGSAKWRETKTRISIPCAIDGREKECVIVDHRGALVVSMPAGTPTKEYYRFVADPKTPTDFKVVTCSMSRDHIMISGYRRGQDVASVILIDRSRQWVTFLCTDIPISNILISTYAPDTMLLGMAEGTILRCPIGQYREGRVAITVYAPFNVKIARATLREDDEVLKKRLDATERLLKAVRKEHGAYARVDMFEAPQGRGDHEDWITCTSRQSPILTMVEHGRRLVATTSIAVNLFRQFGSVLRSADGKDDEGSRRVAMGLEGNAWVDFRGNMLVLHKEDNSIQMVHLHTYRLEVAIRPPNDLSRRPPEAGFKYSSIALHDAAITIFHVDGSRRIIEMNPTAPFLRPPSRPLTANKAKNKKNGKGKK